MARKLVLIVLILSLCVSSLISCSEKSGSDTLAEYLKLVQEGKFDDAYDMIIATGIAKPSDFGKESFSKLYSDFYETMKIGSFEYTITSAYNGEKLAEFEYKLTYNSEIAGSISDDYKVLVKKNANNEWKIQWSPDLILPEMGYGSYFTTSTVKAKRGDILADGEIYAQTVPFKTVSIVFAGATDVEISERVSCVSRITGMSTADIHERIDKAIEYEKSGKSNTGVAFVCEKHPADITSQQINELNSMDGVKVEDSSYSFARQYPNDSILAHTIGYIQDGKGVSGLEEKYDAELTGTDGKKISLHSKDGAVKRVMYKQDATDGNDIQLTVKPDLQRKAEELLKEYLEGEELAGAVMVINPTTGAVEAKASYPTYNLNAFVVDSMKEERQEIVTSENGAMFDRVTRALYQPGSTYKIVTAAAALSYGTVSENYVFSGNIVNDEWTPTNYGWTGKPIKRTHVNRRNEPLNMRNAFVHSDNIYFADLALKMGAEKMKEFWNVVGLNEKIPFELGVSKSQFVNDDNEEMKPWLIADSGFGQGQILVTPLQMASVYSALANGGDIMIPHIVDGLYKENGMDYVPVVKTENKVWKENIISEQICNKITTMLCDVVSPEFNGTGQGLRVTDYTIAGKTGTAQINQEKTQELSWFIGFRTDAPTGEERLVAVVIEVPAEDGYSSYKLNIARELLSNDNQGA